MTSMRNETTIDLRLFATLQKYTPENASRFHIVSGSTIDGLIASLGIPKELSKLIFINGIKGDLKTILKGGERVAIFPPIGGG